ncbi:glycosyl transferase family group 2-domain-containing protein [Daldinia caldariorum]|uniref:glycosyl transferase family group 2-domain-containing protein n=1 Tax=Daldinia caldariorum TaxID=326644 RepID=UPI00200896AC|nr:glycosyl transferase family group 2-domain-containing protein [Daldinia caldariorum]KAI1463737.1 glycosyl transferase family group 2-domain-containing protein [Daldinia caldariorum]
MGFYGYFKPKRPAQARQTETPRKPQRRIFPEGTFDGLINLNDFKLPWKSPLGKSSSVKWRDSYFSAGVTEEVKQEVMVNWLYQQQCSRLWVSEGSGDYEGVLLRRNFGSYLSCPSPLKGSKLAKACSAINVECILTVSSRVIRSFLSSLPGAMSVPLSTGLRIQVLPSIKELPRARKHQGAAFLALEGLLVVWDDNPLCLIDRGEAIEAELLALVWRFRDSDKAKEKREKEEGEEEEEPDYSPTEVGIDLGVDLGLDVESGQVNPENRPVHLSNTCLISFVVFLVTLSLGAAWRQLAIEVSVDGSYSRLGLVVIFPVQVFFSLFFAQVLVGCLAQMFGPVTQLSVNSKYYSALPPPRLMTTTLPHVTIQCPVYKEGLETVIQPTVLSIQRAMSTYELQGGTANMFINDDGLQLIAEEERLARIAFYSSNSIGWVARPKHGENGFLRRGKFKKASNMNYALMISCKVEDQLLRHSRMREWAHVDETLAYEQALKQVLEEDERAWADGNIRVGDYILLIDSDTRVPADCLLDAVSEMEQSPNIGIMQFSSGVMQVVQTYFENGITFFTRLIYSAIRYTVANGDVAPFVGHNAILRWGAVRQISYRDEDGYDKVWSESHVSEDFDMSLRLQCRGYIVRLAAWADEDFKEGVSLTVYDELARWEKYAYGCNELLFHPIRKWLWKGPFTPLFRQFLLSNVCLTSKITVVSYIGTYYAIGAAWIMTSANYFIIGWFNGYLDKYYIDSWKVWFSIVIVFNGLGNIGLAVMRYRMAERSFAYALYENFKWTFLLAVFLGGLSLHVSQALLCHMFEVDMSWGATSKEAEFSNFWIEVPRVIKKFKYSMIFSLLFIVGMIILAVAPFIPQEWRITDFVAILPMATVATSHFLLPLALNPALMTFSW